MESNHFWFCPLFDQKQQASTLFLNDEEWAKFESLMEADEEPANDLRKLMKNSKPNAPPIYF